MYSRESSVRERGKAPSFSSTLLDEIYRSIDDGTVREERSNVAVKLKRNEEEAQKARLVEKWMQRESAENKSQIGVGSGGGYRRKNNKSPEKMEVEKKKKIPVPQTLYVENDPLFFSSGSTSSDSNSSLFSEHDSGPVIQPKTRSSCFLPPKPIRTAASSKTEKRSGKTEHGEEGEIPASAKSRALKLYVSLKKMKQPISPGVRFTTFLNSILSNPKKSNLKKMQTEVEDEKAKKPTCSSATTFSRSFLNQQTPAPIRPTAGKRTVRFVQVANEEDSNGAVRKQSSLAKHPTRNRAVGDTVAKTVQKPVNVVIELVKRRSEEEEDAESDCSEDLFEIDHLKINTGNGGTRFRDELPVYETTSISSSNSNLPNRVVKKGLIL